MSSYRKQNGVTNFRQYQAPTTSQIPSSNSSSRSYYSHSQPSNNNNNNYSTSFQQKKPIVERKPLNLTNYRANLMPSNSNNVEKSSSSYSPILNYQFSHRVNYSKNFEKKEEPTPSYSSSSASKAASYNSSNSKIAKSSIQTEDISPSPTPSYSSHSFQISKSNNKDSESYFRPTSFHLKYSSVMANFQYKDDYKPTEYVTKSSSASLQLLKSIQEQNQTQSQVSNSNQNQTFDPNAKDQEKPNFDYNASLFFAKQALLNGSNYKQYRNDDYDQKDSSQTDLNQNYDIQKSSQPNYNTSQFNLNNNDNGNTITSYYSKSNPSSDTSYKNNFSFNNSNNSSIFNNDSKTNYSFNSSTNNTNSITTNNNENELDDDDFLTKLKKSISSSVSGENSNQQPKYDRDSFTSFHMLKNENNTNNRTYEEEAITIDIPKKKEKVDSLSVQNGNDNGLDLQAKLAKFRQTISLVRKTEEDYGDMFPQEKSKTENNNDDKDGDQSILKDTTNDMLSEPSLIFADSQNQS